MGKTLSPFFLGFTILSFLLISYGSYLDYTRIEINFYSLSGLSLSFFSSILGICFVVLEVQEKRLMFIIGIIGSILSLIYLTFWSPLIWDILITIVYLVLNAYALFYWKHPHKMQQGQTGILTRSLSIKEIYFYTLIALLGTSLLSYIGIHLGRYSSPMQAISDATTTAVSIIGQWFLSKKILEMWYMWIIANIISIPLYISIGSYTYALVYFSYLIISFYGLITWRNSTSHIKYPNNNAEDNIINTIKNNLK